MTQTADDRSADQALKARHRAMWGLGDYPTVASELIPTLGPIVVEAVDVKAGDRVLDIAAGTGNAAIPAARTGAHVIASDLTPALLDAGRQLAATEAVELEWQEADAEALPFDDDAFDVVVSVVGIMFAPHHQESADELVRVCAPGGRIGLISWTPEGFIGQLFKTMKPFAPPPPPGAQPPPLWGDEAHVRELLGGRITDVVVRRQSVEITHFPTPEAFRDFFKTCYGPTIAAYKGLADDSARVAELDAALDELARGAARGSGSMVLDWEYLLLTARKRA